MNTFLPKKIVSIINSKFGHFLVILTTISLINAGLLSLVYYHMAPQDPAFATLLTSLLTTLFFVLLILFGVLAWLFLLAHETRMVAQEESNRQTHLLIEEIDAHKETDLALQQAKEFAEAANQAKSRYLTGISHELRTPLQSILGYAQLLSRDPTIPEERKESIAIMHRSGEYLADLIEGLLDLSKIEAGKLDIYHQQVDLQQLLSQMDHMFSQQAQAKSIVFNYHATSHLPRYVKTDEKRLRQILINVISNAIKFTEQGSVNFSVRYRSQVAEFTVTDTGVGIEPEDMQRIFRSFERVRKPGSPNVSGTGLGLTIVQLLCDIMGGDISFTSVPGKGSTFKIMLMLSSIETPAIPIEKLKPVIGFEGDPKTLLVVDDEPNHRGLICDLLQPLGFEVLEAADAQSCLTLLDQQLPDVFLIDVSMPGMNGLELAGILRERGIRKPIIMISGDAQERHTKHDPNFAHNAYLVKPIKIQSLHDQLSRLMKIDWIYQKQIIPAPEPVVSSPTDFIIPNHPNIAQLLSYAEIGYSQGFKTLMKNIEAENLLDTALINHLNQLSKQLRYDKIVELLHNTQS